MRFLIWVTFVFVMSTLGAQSWQSLLLEVDEAQKLHYKPCDNGFVLPDFSHAGYKGGVSDLPQVAVVKTIEAISGDNTSHIQSAIDEVGGLSPNSEGIRGAVLLKAGKYEVAGTIKLSFSGVVLRGEGDGTDPESNTIILATGNTPHQRDVMIAGNASKTTWSYVTPGSKSDIVTDIVPVGSFSFEVESAAAYKVGDQIIILHPSTHEWLEAVDFGGVPDPAKHWSVGQVPVIFNRYVTDIVANTIYIDAPLFYSLNRSLSPSYIYKPGMSGTVYNVGVEDLRIEIETLGGEDENHAWQALRFISCENAWAQNCTFAHFGESGIITQLTTRSTFLNCRAIDPVAKVTGGRMYNFNTYHRSQLNLFENCYARNGRHNYVSNGASTTSGNVFLNCVSDGAYNVSEGHRLWTTGMLFDNHVEVNLRREFVLGLYNRIDFGSGHGWSAAHSVLWNCDVTSGGLIVLHEPPTAQNYAIGCMAKSITGRPYSSIDYPLGYVEGTNQVGLIPQSLYRAQLTDRTINPPTSIDRPSITQSKVIFIFDQRSGIVTLLNQQTLAENNNLFIIFDVTGRMVHREKLEVSLNNGTIRFNKKLPPGMYLFTIMNSKQRFSEKILVR